MNKKLSIGRFSRWIVLGAVAAAIGLAPGCTCDSNDDGPTGPGSSAHGISFISVSAGTFTMGSPASDALRDGDEVQHVASVGAYRISKYPITNKQYYAVTEQALPAALKGKEEYPVTNVTWMQARSFAQSIGGDLPTEAQWEYAARGGVRHENKLYSGSDNLGEVGVYQANSNGVMQPVGKKKANGLGLYDMSGNVWEWTLDTYLAYPGDDNPSFPVPSETYPAKVHRGGSYLSDLKECRVSERAASRGQEGGPDVGFRVVLPPAAE